MPSLREMMNSGSERVQNISLSLIRKSEQNFYEVKGESDYNQKVSAMQKSILEKGQLEPIIILDKQGEYEIVSGHTRFETISHLHEDGLHDDTIKAIIINENLDDFSKMGLIVESNLQREKNIAQIEIEIKYYEKLFEKLKERGEVSGRKDDFVAERMGKTGRTIRNYRKKLYQQDETSSTTSQSNENQRQHTTDDVIKNLKKIKKLIQKTYSMTEEVGHPISQLEGIIESFEDFINDYNNY